MYMARVLSVRGPDLPLPKIQVSISGRWGSLTLTPTLTPTPNRFSFWLCGKSGGGRESGDMEKGQDNNKRVSETDN